MLLPEGLLNRMERAVAREALDRRHRGAVGLHRQHRARLHGLAVQVDGACAALRGLAADFCSREPDAVAHEVDEQRAGRDLGFVASAVDGDRDVGQDSLLPSVRPASDEDTPRPRRFPTASVGGPTTADVRVYPPDVATTIDARSLRHGRVRGRYFRKNFAQAGIDLVQIVPELATNAAAAIAAGGRRGRIHLRFGSPDSSFVSAWKHELRRLRVPALVEW